MVRRIGASLSGACVLSEIGGESGRWDDRERGMGEEVGSRV